ncbi:MAG: DUF4861 family protein [Bacteroidales bacterium]|nr:DUF4861 family protein [Bacteroidales bacterium]
MKKTLLCVLAILAGAAAYAQQHCFYSQFRLTDKQQVTELWSPQDNEFRQIGHHGPAVENQYMALRFYYDGRGAIDIYSKTGKIDDELGKWHWYPTEEQQKNEGAGCDEYFVGKTVGLGGVRLWDGEKEVRLDGTAGRRSIVGRRGNNVWMEMTAYGVEYKGEKVDISLRVDVYDGSRWANVTAKELNGRKVQFATGVNYHPGSVLKCGEDYIAVWGIHPANVSQNPGPMGGGMRFQKKKFEKIEDIGGAFRLISKPASELNTSIVSASWREDEINNAAAFVEMVAGKPVSLKVASYNIRFGTAKDGANSWDKRKAGTPAMLAAQAPDVFGVQEALSFQLDYILEKAPQYRCVGVGREDGRSEGETMAVFYNRKRLKLVKWGTYWLSETPDKPSKGWDAYCKRTATWTLFKDRATGQKFFYVNTHLDHRGKDARLKGLSLIVDNIARMNPEGWPMLLGGDFNVLPSDPCLKALEGKMTDSRMIAFVTDGGPTFNAWGRQSDIESESPRIIDYIYCSGFAGCPSFRVVTDDYGVPFLSDHYPIVATFVF